MLLRRVQISKQTRLLLPAGTLLQKDTMTESELSTSGQILEQSIPIIDAHHHLFDRPGRRYMMDDYVADVSTGHNIVASVYVETEAMLRRDGPEVLRPLGEIEFANGVGAMSASGRYGSTRVCAGIVGYADLTAGDGIRELLDRSVAAAPDRFRGVRQVTIEHPTESAYRYMTNRPRRGLMDHPEFRKGFAQLAPRGLTFDAAILHHQLPQICQLADDFPDTTIVIGHMGMAIAMKEDGQKPSDAFDPWRTNLARIASRPNVVCKVGGLGMPFWGFGFDEAQEQHTYLELASAWAPYIETAIEFFGPDRCMFESNFPMDARSCDFPTLWNALKCVVTGYSPTEKTSLFSGTAKQIYRLDLPADLEVST
jgi:L-fuconolactonase